MILVHTIVDHDDRLYAYEVPAFSILPRILWRSGQAEFIRAEIILRDMRRYTIAVPVIFGLFRYSDIGRSCTFTAISTGRPRRDLEAIASRS